MPFEGRAIRLSATQRSDLEEMTRSQALPAGLVWRTKMVMLLADGHSVCETAARLATPAMTVTRWKHRFLADGVDGLDSRHPGRTAWKLAARLRARSLSATRRPPATGATQWSCRTLAQHLGISKDLVQRAWREADLRPHRLARYMASTVAHPTKRFTSSSTTCRLTRRRQSLSFWRSIRT